MTHADVSNNPSALLALKAQFDHKMRERWVEILKHELLTTELKRNQLSSQLEQSQALKQWFHDYLLQLHEAINGFNSEHIAIQHLLHFDEY